MDKMHVVEKTVFDFSFSGEEETFEVQEELGSFVRERLMGAVNDIFDEFSTDGKLIRIDSLEIDLEEFEYHSFRGEMEVRLREVLRSALREKIGSLGNPLKAGEDVVTVRQSDFEQICFFLLKGRLPWNNSILKGRSIEQVLRDVFHSNGKRFVSFIGKSPKREMIVKRLVSQFPDATLAGITKIVLPDHYRFFEDIVPFLMSSLRDRGVEGKDELTCLIRETVIDELLILEGTFPGDKVMSDRILKNISRRLGEALPSIPDISEKVRVDGKIDKDEDSTNKKRRGSYIDFMCLRIKEALITGSAKGIKSLWSEIVRDNKELFLEELRRYGIRVAVRRKIAEGFGDPLLKEIVLLIEPVEGAFICDVVERREAFRLALHKPPEEERGLKRRLWEFTLAYLLVERGGRFNKKIYMGSMLRQMAAHSNIKYTELVASLSEVLKKSSGDSGLRDEMLGLLGELVHEDSGAGNLMEAGDMLGEKTGANTDRTELLRWRIEEALVTGRAGGIKDIWSEILADSKELFLEELRRHGVRVAVRRKIAEGFGDLLLKEIVFLIEPVEGGFICDVVNKREVFRLALNKEPVEERGLKRRLWEFTLAYLLVERGSRFNKKVYMGSMLRQMAAHGNMRYEGLIASLDDVLKKSSGDSGLRDEMLGLLGELAHEEGGAGDLTEAGDRLGKKTGTNKGRAEELRWRIKEALITGSAKGIKDLWSEIMRNHSALFLEEFRLCGVRIAVRRKVASGFEEPMLKEIIRLIEPMEAGFICDMADRREIFWQASGKAQVEAGGLKRQFWEFTLAYLLVERGSRFNKKSYMGSILRQMAAHSNIKYADLAASLRELLERGGRDGGNNRDILQLLGELSENVEVKVPGKEDEVSLSEELIRSYELIEELKGYFAGHRTNVNFETILDELSRKFPWKILELFREMQSGRIDALKAVSRLSAIELGRFVEALISLVGGGAEDSDLAAAAAAYAKKSKNLKKYYRDLLDHLVLGKVVDFEAIVSENLTHGKEDEKEMPSDVSKDVDDCQTSSLSNDEGEVLLEMLAAGRSLSNSEAGRLMSWVGTIIAASPWRLKYILNPLVEETWALKRIIGVMSAPLLARLLFLLRGERYYALLRCADIIASACLALKNITYDVQIEKLKWQFIFSFIYNNGRNLNEAQFARLFSKYLAGEMGRGNERAFQDELAGQLAHDILPSTREEHSKVMEALTKDDSSPARVEPFTSPSAASEEKETEETPSDEEEIFTEEVYIANAGQVLAAPYLPRLFDTLGLMDQGKFKDRHAAERGVHLLQFMVNGSECSPEYQLVLNKILCGVKMGVPILREITAGVAEKEAVEGLMAGMINNWPGIGKTSITGFRESFLQREGVLRLKDDTWSLLVEAKPFDMLLDQIPWSFKTIKHPWMERVIHVEWR